MASHDIPIGASQVSLATLNERSREIFRSTVESDLSRRFTRPVAHSAVLAVAGLDAQRMFYLEQLGLIFAPRPRGDHVAAHFLYLERCLIRARWG